MLILRSLFFVCPILYQETFGPIPPPMYAERMLAFFMGCALRWHENPASFSEDARRTMIGGFCDAYGKPWDSEELRTKIEAKGHSMVKEFRNICQSGQERTLYGVQLFKELTEEKRQHWWTFVVGQSIDYLFLKINKQSIFCPE